MRDYFRYDEKKMIDVIKMINDLNTNHLKFRAMIKLKESTIAPAHYRRHIVNLLYKMGAVSEDYFPYSRVEDYIQAGTLFYDNEMIIVESKLTLWINIYCYEGVHKEVFKICYNFIKNQLKIPVEDKIYVEEKREHVSA